jgi:hypothetical protein
MLQGADLILWPATGTRRSLLSIARCRADENRVFVALAAHATAGAGCALLAPGGGVIATAPVELELAVGGFVQPALSRSKDIAPGTNVLFGRQPTTYGALLEG